MTSGIALRELDTMELPDVWAQVRYWQRNPPAHLLLRGLVSPQTVPQEPESRQWKAPDLPGGEQSRSFTDMPASMREFLSKRHG